MGTSACGSPSPSIMSRYQPALPASPISPDVTVRNWRRDMRRPTASGPAMGNPPCGSSTRARAACASGLPFHSSSIVSPWSSSRCHSQPASFEAMTRSAATIQSTSWPIWSAFAMRRCWSCPSTWPTWYSVISTPAPGPSGPALASGGAAGEDARTGAGMVIIGTPG